LLLESFFRGSFQFKALFDLNFPHCLILVLAGRRICGGSAFLHSGNYSDSIADYAAIQMKHFPFGAKVCFPSFLFAHTFHLKGKGTITLTVSTKADLYPQIAGFEYSFSNGVYSYGAKYLLL